MLEKKLRFWSVAAIAVLGLTSSGLAQSDDPVWLQELEIQSAREHDCQVNYFVNIREFQLGDNNIQEARIVCIDSRQFDATRDSENVPFTIRACKPVVC